MISCKIKNETIYVFGALSNGDVYGCRNLGSRDCSVCKRFCRREGGDEKEVADMGVCGLGVEVSGWVEEKNRWGTRGCLGFDLDVEGALRRGEEVKKFLDGGLKALLLRRES